MIRFSRRGSVLIHILVTGVIVSIIAAGLLRMTLMSYIAVDRAAKGAQNRKEAEGMLNRAITYWNASGIVCSTDANFTCATPSATSPGTCSCACPSAVALPRVEVSGGGAPPCTITVISSDPP